MIPPIIFWPYTLLVVIVIGRLFNQMVSARCTEQRSALVEAIVWLAIGTAGLVITYVVNTS